MSHLFPKIKFNLYQMRLNGKKFNFQCGWCFFPQVLRMSHRCQEAFPGRPVWGGPSHLWCLPLPANMPKVQAGRSPWRLEALHFQLTLDMQFCLSWELCHLKAQLPRWATKLSLLGAWQHCEEPECYSWLKNPQACIHWQPWKWFSLSPTWPSAPPRQCAFPHLWTSIAQSPPKKFSKQHLRPQDKGTERPGHLPKAKRRTKQTLTTLEIGLPCYHY